MAEERRRGAAGRRRGTRIPKIVAVRSGGREGGRTDKRKEPRCFHAAAGGSGGGEDCGGHRLQVDGTDAARTESLLTSRRRDARLTSLPNLKGIAARFTWVSQ